MAQRAALLAGVLASLCLLINAQDLGKVLVVHESPIIKTTHNLYFKNLQKEGWELEFKKADDSTLQLREWDTWLYDKLILFASSVTGFGGALDVAGILEFIDAGHDVLIAVDGKASDELRDLILEVGVDVEQQGTSVHDLVNYLTAVPVDPTKFITSKWSSSPAITDLEETDVPVVFKGIGLTIPKDSELVIKALTAEDTAYSTFPNKQLSDLPALLGKQIVLVAAVQTRNNARVAVSGSIDLFSDKFFTEPVTVGVASYPENSNERFSADISDWTFHRRGVLVADNLRHHKAGEAEQQGSYRVTDDLDFAIDVKEFSSGQWKPYLGKDLQLEFVMLDPHIITYLEPDFNGTFSTRFKVPDVYGVFKFVINYKRLGYSYIEIQEQIPIRPFRHNEYERFLLCAYPYYASVASTMVAFFLLGLVLLYSK